MSETIKAGRWETANLAEALLVPRPLPVLLLVSFAGTAVFCLLVFDSGFLLGTSPYWHAPRGLVGKSWADLPTALSGYNYFVRDVWKLPLLQTTKLGLPNPVTIISTGSVAIVCLLGRVLYQTTGLMVNPFGVWAVLCLLGAASAMTALVAQLGGRGIAAAVAATVFGLCMPTLLARWGHLSLMAQWEPILALLVYFRSGTSQWRIRGTGSTLLLAVVTLFTDAYLFVMVMGILAATLARGLAERRLSVYRAGLVVASFAVVLGCLLSVGGFLDTGGSLQDGGFGTFSANLLSPLVPLPSAIFPALSQNFYDPTGGQYEGYCYIGLGGMFLLVVALPWLCCSVRQKLYRLAPLLVVVAGFTLFALSNHIYVGPWQAIHIPLPTSVLALASIFRSSGRFVWPALYALVAALIAGAAARWGRAGAWLLIIAALLQILDTAPLRSALSVRTAEAAAVPLSQARWSDAIRRHDLLRVVPSWGCLRKQSGLRQQMASELELLGSGYGIATNNVYAARHQFSCGTSPVTKLADNALLVFLLPTSRANLSADLAAHCAASTKIMVCSRKMDHAQLAELTRVQPTGCGSVLSYEDMGFRLLERCRHAPDVPNR